MNNQLDNLIPKFLNYLGDNGRDDQTVKNYHFYLKRFLDWSKITTVDELTLELIEAYRQWLDRQVNQTKKPLEDSTKNYHLIALRSLIDYCNNNGTSSLDARRIRLAKLPIPQTDSLNNFELEKLLAAPLEIKLKKIIQWRDKAILELLFSTGLRVSELTNLQTNQINLDQNDFIVQGRYKKSRRVFLSNQAKFWLRQYLKAREAEVSPFLFIRYDRAAKKQTRKKITARSIQRLINQYAKSAGIKKPVTPQVIRHSLARNLIKAGHDIESIQALLGHHSISTTKKYRR